MSTKSTATTDIKGKSANEIGSSIAKFMVHAIDAPGVRITYDPNETTVVAHGSENYKVNGGVLKFSDTRYGVGINIEKDGSVSFVYDSYVEGNKLGKRINGVKNPHIKNGANAKICINLGAAERIARKNGQQLKVMRVGDKVKAFIPAAQ